MRAKTAASCLATVVYLVCLVNSQSPGMERSSLETKAPSASGVEPQINVHSLLGKSSKLPTRLLNPKENNKTNAQYFFSDDTVEVLVSILKTLDVTTVINVGTPRLHEELLHRKLCRSFLLDIDGRFRDFYTLDQYSRYNMFNHHFFEGAEAEKSFQQFCEVAEPQCVLLVVDPPYGGRVDLLTHSLLALSRCLLQRDNDPTQHYQQQPLAKAIVFLPYFMESHIKANLPEFAMSDYKVTYENHAVFSSDKKSKHRGSPGRFFTNIPLGEIPLPQGEGYRFCKKCCRFVSLSNKHCATCDSCTTKDGPSYRHCDACNKCVKPSWVHCQPCRACRLGTHVHGEECVVLEEQLGCFKCGGNHKRKQCTQTNAAGQQKAKKKVSKGKKRKWKPQRATAKKRKSK